MDKNNLLGNIRKYHISIFSTNLLAIVLAISFIRSYRTKGIPVLPSLLGALIILLVFLSVCIFVLKPYGKIKNIFPSMRLILVNLIIALIVSLIFLKQIGILGFIFTLIFASLLFEVEHVIYEGIRR